MGVEPTKLTAWMVGCAEDGVDGGLVAVDDVEDAVGEAGFLEHFGEEDGGAGVALGGLEDEGVAAGQRDGEHPHGDHRGEVEGGDAGDDAERLADGPGVDAGADLLCEFALQKLWDSGGELDVFEAAGGFAAGVGVDLAVLGGDEGGDLVEALLEDLAEAEEHAGAAERRLRGPGREGGSGGGYGGVDFGVGGEGDAGLDLAGGGVEDVGIALRGSGDGGTVDPVGQFAGLFGCLGVSEGGDQCGHGECSFANGDFTAFRKGMSWGCWLERQLRDSGFDSVGDPFPCLRSETWGTRDALAAGRVL